jgi:hypothetical protein
MYYIREGETDSKSIELEELLRGVTFGKIRPNDMITNSENEWIVIKNSQFFENAIDSNIQLHAALQLLVYKEGKKSRQVDVIEQILNHTFYIRIMLLGFGAVMLLGLIAEAVK